MTNHRDPKPTRSAAVPATPARLNDEGVLPHDYQRLLGEGPSFWDAMVAWRGTVFPDDTQHLLGVDIDPRDFPRDKSPGRDPPF